MGSKHSVVKKTEPKPRLRSPDERVQQLEQTEAALEKEQRERAPEVEAPPSQHETKLESYSAQVAGMQSLDEAATVSLTADVRRLAEDRALHVMQQRLNAVPHVDDATFEPIPGPLHFDERDFPFMRLTPGRLRDGTLVLRIQLEFPFKNDEEARLRLKQTLAIMHALDGGDGTLLRLIGGCDLDSDDPIAYVEHVTGIGLSTYLMNQQNATWAEKLWIASQVAKAIAHIHNVECMHRDVSWSRIFVEATGNVTVFASFMLRQVQAYESYLSSGIAEHRWGAPETLATADGSATTSTDKIDIFGLGLILISLVTRDLPFTYIMKRSGRGGPIDDDLLAARLVKRETAIPMLTQPFEHECECPSKEYKTLAFECITYDPERRPTAPEAARRLETIRHAYSGGTIKTPDNAKVDLTIELLKTSGVLYVPDFGDSYDMWCEIKIDDGNYYPIQLEPVTGSADHLFNQEATLKDIEPLSHSVKLVHKTSPTFTSTQTIGKVSIPLMDLLTLEDSLTALRKKTFVIFKEGDIVGVVEIAVRFGARLRGYLELFERQTTEHLRNNTEDGQSTLDLRKKRDLAAQALGLPSLINTRRPTPREEINFTGVVAALPLKHPVRMTPNVPSLAGLTASAKRLETVGRELRLHTAASNGELDEVDALLKEKVDPNCSEKLLARTPLHSASLRGNVAVVKRLLQADANINALEANGCTPLDLATRAGHLDVCALLQAADTSFQSKSGGAKGTKFCPEPNMP
ncbi:serine/threonine protein kinase [Saprolegnia diclina VS20]|uniref:Serine/threonine protein kinase n=1 Tax=Saprolegnia diclina (strain VS20) TaxID=1156394 RepID=T0S7Z6_SAPDV|nr:serine/threonine protein kinase [Saprolegnia diclina VS20]EQC38922.1 serine/threonine protein kinase [Saprolegnia diclina VS20]|eukprot:XP_008607746.1 serine/threonine protein kinase [Saprolegnia diclina VS20]